MSSSSLTTASENLSSLSLSSVLRPKGTRTYTSVILPGYTYVRPTAGHLTGVARVMCMVRRLVLGRVERKNCSTPAQYSQRLGFV